MEQRDVLIGQWLPVQSSYWEPVKPSELSAGEGSFFLSSRQRTKPKPKSTQHKLYSVAKDGDVGTKFTDQLLAQVVRGI